MMVLEIYRNQYKDPSAEKDFHYEDNTFVRPSYEHNGNPYNDKIFTWEVK